MYKRIDLNNLGGLPVYQDTLAFMQDSYRNAFVGLAAAFGNKVIISGVEDTGLNYTDGWVFVDGELMPFSGGAKNEQIKVEEVTDIEVFEDDTVNTVYYTKRAVLALVGGYPVADFGRMDSVNKIYNDLVALKKSAVPTGAIIMWSGAIVDIPTGWALCDGTNGTPNLSGKFIVGYDPTDSDYNAIGKTGGERKHTLSASELPNFNLSLPGQQGGDNSDHNNLGVFAGGDKTPSDTSFNFNLSVDYSRGKSVGQYGQSHENRPPFFTLAYIIKKP